MTFLQHLQCQNDSSVTKIEPWFKCTSIYKYYVPHHEEVAANQYRIGPKYLFFLPFPSCL